MAIEEPPPIGVPEWVVSFGDMMSLLLTFFIMLVSFSEPKKDEKFAALVAELQQHFGKDLAKMQITPGGVIPRQAAVATRLNQGRADRKKALGGDKAQRAVPGEAPQVRMIRPGGQTAIGTIVYFDEGSAELTEKAREDIRTQHAIFAGKPQKIEVRGHTSLRELQVGSDYEDNWELAYHRSRNVMRFLVEELHTDPLRIRLSVAGPGEPLHLGVDAAKMRENPRAELYLLEEVVSDLHGTPAERHERFTDPTDATP